jgi:lysylphosphatidylglycerol synthetase-like protein (DUF2156 family)
LRGPASQHHDVRVAVSDARLPLAVAVVVALARLLAILDAFAVFLVLVTTTSRRSTTTRGTIETASRWAIEAAAWRTSAESAWTRSAKSTTATATATLIATTTIRRAAESTTATRSRSEWTRSATAAAAWTTSFAFASLVDPELTTVELLSVELLQRLRGALRCRELDECEAARTSGLSIHDDRDAYDFATVRSECFSE